MLELEPGAAEAHDRSAAADVVDGRDGFGHKSGVPERVGADEQSKWNAFGGLRNGRERRVTLEDRLVGVAEDREEVVPGPERVEPERFGALCGGQGNPGQSLAWLQRLAPSFTSVMRRSHPSAQPMASIVRKRLYALDFLV